MPIKICILILVFALSTKRTTARIAPGPAMEGIASGKIAVSLSVFFANLISAIFAILTLFNQEVERLMTSRI